MHIKLLSHFCMQQLLVVILISFCLEGFSQVKEMPISNEIPKRGIYKTFEEFKFNVPSITDSFF